MVKNLKSIIIIAMIALVTISGATSCKSSGKMTKKEYKAKVEQATKDLNAILNNETSWSLEEQMDRVNEIKQVDFSKKNPEIVEMIERAEAKIAREMEERDRLAEIQRLEEEQRLRELAEQNQANKGIADLFNLIANAKDVNTANNYIKEALKLFESPDAVVLIRLNNYGDYDRPTTAVNYLNYLKDQKKVTVNVDNIKYNAANKITELELIKK
ncbi:MAG: hypothetical protein CW336_00055 [Bacteroidetes bacterium]|jgi:hypothetical protein|nr:hypothetical protein [Bacteroidota bacterium]MBO6056999.1 hypothetical protein [Bacteroidales bacterium]